MAQNNNRCDTKIAELMKQLANVQHQLVLNEATVNVLTTCTSAFFSMVDENKRH